MEGGGVLMLTEREVEVGKAAIDARRRELNGERCRQSQEFFGHTGASIPGTELPMEEALRVAWDAIERDKGLGILGRERAVVDGFAKTLRRAIETKAEYTAIRPTRRGSYFELRTSEAYSTGAAVLRVEVTFDRIENDV